MKYGRCLYRVWKMSLQSMDDVHGVAFFETQENKSDIYNQGTQENQSNNNKKSYDSYMDQSTVDIQPTLDAATGRYDGGKSNCKEIEKQKNTLSVKPIQQKQLKKQHMSRKIDKNQPRIDNFSHVVITDEKQDIIDNQDVQAVISEDESSQERKKTRVFKKTATAIRDDISDTEALSLKDVVEANKNFTLAQPKEEVDARRNFTQAQLKELMSEDEDSPVKRVVKVEESPIKRVVKSAKKAFAWNDSDEETQDFLTIKLSVYDHLPRNCKVVLPNGQCCVMSNVVTSRPIPTVPCDSCFYKGQCHGMDDKWIDDCKYKCEFVPANLGFYRCKEL
ncbi:unnamed protein product [Mytilus edulis]|uniref:Uncharacterized protein n=1 Tax=Mytilus edulis TaxID=6550 RepID=A0A8S3PVX9_MYTED|nr:unnamed protein product [Mytilus edulis]